EYDLSFSNNRNKTNSTSTGLNPQYSSELELNITQPLLKGFGIDLNKREIYIASNDVKISDLDFEEQVIDIVSDVENAYWDLVFSIDDLEVKKTSLERAQDFQRRVEAQVEVGTLAPLEILQAKSEVASREELLLSAEDLIKDNEDRLKNFLNIGFNSTEGMSTLTPADRPSMQDVDIDLESSIQNAIKKRPDYLAKRTDLENKNILVKYNENQIFPSVDLIGSLGLNGISGKTQSSTGRFATSSQFEGRYGQALSDLMGTENFLWKFGVQFSYPLGNRSAKSRLTAARLEAAQLLLDIKDLEKDIIVEVREAARQIKTDVKRVQAARAARNLAEEKLSAEEKKYEVGLSTSFNVLEFQEDLTEEQSNEIKAVIDFNKSLIKLRQVSGTTLEKHNIKLSSEDDS
ncbi:MAG: TolC family protein, partial [Nitrospinaceae bacterium]